MLRIHSTALKPHTTRVWSVSQCFGGYSVRETPGPIPNPEAKPDSADGTATEGLWESRTPPNSISKRGPRPGRDPVSRTRAPFRIPPGHGRVVHPITRVVHLITRVVYLITRVRRLITRDTRSITRLTRSACP